MTLKERFPGMAKANGNAKNQQSPSQPGEQQHPTPLSSANLQQQQQQLRNQMHQRSNSRNATANTPAAPTSTQPPPFPFGATSPHGTPAYAGKTTLKQEDLHIPARKKQKQSSTPAAGQGTPGSTASPQVAKSVLPDMRRQQSELKQPTKPALCCPEPDCDRHHVGFESQDALTAHIQEEHVRPLNDPLKYVQDNLATTLGLDSQGQQKKPASHEVPRTSSAPAGAHMTATGSGQGQPPATKGESTPAASTPMNRQVSMNRQGSAAGGKPNVQSRSVPAKDTKAQPSQKEAERPKETQAPQEIDPWANSTIDPNDLFQNFRSFETGAGGAISDVNVYRSITPNDTPESSKDGVSEPNSDVSEGVNLDISIDMFDPTWQPFGSGDPGDFLDLSSIHVNSEEDVLMFGSDVPAVKFQSWDDMMEPGVLDKPFHFDTSLFSMNAE